MASSTLCKLLCLKAGCVALCLEEEEDVPREFQTGMDRSWCCQATLLIFPRCSPERKKKKREKNLLIYIYTVAEEQEQGFFNRF